MTYRTPSGEDYVRKVAIPEQVSHEGSTYTVTAIGDRVISLDGSPIIVRLKDHVRFFRVFLNGQDLTDVLKEKGVYIFTPTQKVNTVSTYQFYFRQTELKNEKAETATKIE